MKINILSAKNLTKCFDTNGNQQIVLNGIDVDIFEGDFTVIMGSSGSGKSTLLYMLSMLDKPSSGNVKLLSVDSSDVKQKELEKLRKKDIAFVFQSFNLLQDLTTYENIAFPAYQILDKDVVNKRTEELLDLLDLSEEKDKFPSSMSGGQMQRVAMARALVKNPKVIFADEPTGALNSNAGKQVLDILSEMNRNGQTVVMVTHDIKACTRGNRVIYLKDGKITGELQLGGFSAENQSEREEVVFNFLTKNNW